jgi:hypothetical protein
VKLKTTVEILDKRFRLAMKDGRIDPKKKHDILELTLDQKKNIMEYMRCSGKSVTEEEIDLCFKSFRKQYWKKHVLPPRTKEQ